MGFAQLQYKLQSVASIPIRGGCSLRPVKNKREVLIRLQIKTSPYFSLLVKKNREGGSFVKGVDHAHAHTTLQSGKLFHR